MDVETCFSGTRSNKTGLRRVVSLVRVLDFVLQRTTFDISERVLKCMGAEAGSAISNRREPKSCLVRVLNFNLGCFA